MASFRSYTPLLAVLCTLACREKTSPTASGPTIEIALDDAVRIVTVSRPIPLSSLISAPPSTWHDVRADSTDGRWLEIPQPTTTYPDGELRVYLERERVTIGVFVGAREIASLGPLARVHVSTHAPPAVVAPTLTISDHGREVLLKSQELHHLPEQERRGWELADVIALATKGATRVRIIGDSEQTFDSLANITLKLNQRGEYLVRVWDNDGNTPTREVRNVTKIVLE